MLALALPSYFHNHIAPPRPRPRPLSGAEGEGKGKGELQRANNHLS